MLGGGRPPGRPVELSVGAPRRWGPGNPGGPASVNRAGVGPLDKAWWEFRQARAEVGSIAFAQDNTSLLGILFRHNTD